MKPTDKCLLFIVCLIAIIGAGNATPTDEINLSYLRWALIMQTPMSHIRLLVESDLSINENTNNINIFQWNAAFVVLNNQPLFLLHSSLRSLNAHRLIVRVKYFSPRPVLNLIDLYASKSAKHSLLLYSILEYFNKQSRKHAGGPTIYAFAVRPSQRSLLHPAKQVRKRDRRDIYIFNNSTSDSSFLSENAILLPLKRGDLKEWINLQRVLCISSTITGNIS